MNMINGWIIGGVLFVSAVVIKGVAGYIEIKELENELKKWRAYVDCIKNHEQTKGLDLKPFFYDSDVRETLFYLKAKYDDFDFTKFDIKEFLKYINELQERSALRKQKAEEEGKWRSQNPHIFKNTHIVMDLNNVQSIEKNNARYVVYMKSGGTRWLNFSEGNGIIEQFAKHISKKETI